MAVIHTASTTVTLTTIILPLEPTIYAVVWLPFLDHLPGSGSNYNDAMNYKGFYAFQAKLLRKEKV